MDRGIGLDDPRVQSLPRAHQEALHTHVIVTGQDVEAAMGLLERSGWNTQLSISKFFDGDDGAEPWAPQPNGGMSSFARRVLDDNNSPDPSPPPRPRSRSSRPSRRIDKPEPAPRIPTQPVDPPARRPSLVLGLFFTGYNILWRLCTGGIHVLGVLFPFLPRLLHRLYTTASNATTATGGRLGLGSTGTSTARQLAPKDVAGRFIRTFEETYGTAEETGLRFLENGYNMALELAQQQSKFLLVILLSPEHEHNDTWVRHTLLSPEFTRFLAEHKERILLWGGSVRDSEPFVVANSLRVTKFPCLGVICHTPQVSSSAMGLAARQVGLTTPGELIRSISEAMGRFGPELEGARAARAEREASRSLRAEQDEAYERSLARDRERARRRREEEEEGRRKEKEGRDREAWRRWRAGRIRGEPEVGVEGAVRVNLVMPGMDGGVRRRFEGDVGVEEVFAFVECYSILKEWEEKGGVEEAGEEPPEGFEHRYDFKLVVPMPRMEIDVAQGGSVRERLGRGGTLVVERIDEEEEEEEDGEWEDI